MPMYEYKCTVCGTTGQDERRLVGDFLKLCGCAHCGTRGTIKRVWGFSFKRPMQEHFNTSVGKVIRTDAQLKSEFSRLSDEAEMYTGNPHKFVPIDPHDKEALGVTDEGLASTHDQQVAEGRKEPARRLFLP